MKRKFKLADGTVGLLDTDTGDFTPGSDEQPTHQAQGDEPHFPMPGYENVPPEKPLVHEDPIGDVMIGGRVANGVPKLLEAAGGFLGRAGANATTRLAARTAEAEAAARLAEGAAPSIPESPVRRAGEAVEKLVDLHYPLKPIMNAAVNVAETPFDRLMASPIVARAASAAQNTGSGTHAASFLMSLLGHGWYEDRKQQFMSPNPMPNQAPEPVPPSNLLLDLASNGAGK